jgi:drug/metabolite transporter (DMT)-like permease
MEPSSITAFLDKQHGHSRPWLLTGLAMSAFATNSILCRMALGTHAIDAASFTVVRLGSGAVTLALLTLVLRGYQALAAGSWLSGFQLFLYAAAFSLAYLSLHAGTGALILFGSVQATMIISGLLAGERPHPLQWAGLGIALFGLIYLVFPGMAAPSSRGAFLMALAGLAWGRYSLRGRRAADPVSQTTGNFIRAAPFALAVWAVDIRGLHVQPHGLLLAVLSGSLASGIGYVIWYTALRGLSSTRAAAVQLSVPVLAAFGGVIFLAEVVTSRLLIASILILGGVALTVIAKELKAANNESTP